jgi:hypothetical protein
MFTVTAHCASPPLRQVLLPALRPLSLSSTTAGGCARSNDRHSCRLHSLCRHASRHSSCFAPFCIDACHSADTYFSPRRSAPRCAHPRLSAARAARSRLTQWIQGFQTLFWSSWRAGVAILVITITSTAQNRSVPEHGNPGNPGKLWSFYVQFRNAKKQKPGKK